MKRVIQLPLIDLYRPLVIPPAVKYGFNTETLDEIDARLAGVPDDDTDRLSDMMLDMMEVVGLSEIKERLGVPLD